MEGSIPSDNEERTRQELIGFIVTRLVRVPTDNLLDIVEALENAETKSVSAKLRLLEQNEENDP